MMGGGDLTLPPKALTDCPKLRQVFKDHPDLLGPDGVVNRKALSDTLKADDNISDGMAFILRTVALFGNGFGRGLMRNIQRGIFSPEELEQGFINHKGTTRSFEGGDLNPVLFDRMSDRLEKYCGPNRIVTTKAITKLVADNVRDEPGFRGANIAIAEFAGLAAVHPNMTIDQFLNFFLFGDRPPTPSDHKATVPGAAKIAFQMLPVLGAWAGTIPGRAKAMGDAALEELRDLFSAAMPSLHGAKIAACPMGKAVVPEPKLLPADTVSLHKALTGERYANKPIVPD